MKKILALIMVVAMMATMASVAFAADEPTPIASWDFTKDLKDHSGRNLADLVIATDPENPTDDQLKAQTSARASRSEEGLKLENGFIKLPDNIFTGIDEKNITGLTVSMTINSAAMPDGWSKWAEALFYFSSDEILSEVAVEERANASIYLSFNGNVGTAKYQYGNNKEEEPNSKNWMDGSLGGKLEIGKTANVTLTYDVATNVATIYVDGVKVKDSTESAWTPGCSLTAADIHSLKFNALGLPTGGSWNMWGFTTYKNVSIYSSALSADQVKTVAEAGLGIKAPAADTPATGDNGEQPPTASQTGVATVALAIVAMGSGAYIVSKKRH